MNTQSAIMELLNIEPMGVNDLASKTATSAGYIRTQLKAMEAAGMVERVDNRMPFIYKPGSGKSVSVKNAEDVITFKKRLLTNDDKGNFVIEYLNKYPKSTWPGAIDMLAIASQALKELNDENKLVDTL